jgi:hypothetical protein
MILMQCLGCGTMVKNPKTINYMYEKCNVCYAKQKEQEELAIDTYLHGQAEQKREHHAS